MEKLRDMLMKHLGIHGLEATDAAVFIIESLKKLDPDTNPNGTFRPDPDTMNGREVIRFLYANVGDSDAFAHFVTVDGKKMVVYFNNPSTWEPSLISTIMTTSQKVEAAGRALRFGR